MGASPPRLRAPSGCWLCLASTHTASQPHSHSASRWLNAVAVALTRFAELPSCWKYSIDRGDGAVAKCSTRMAIAASLMLRGEIRFEIIAAVADERFVEQRLDLAIRHRGDLVCQ